MSELTREQKVSIKRRVQSDPVYHIEEVQGCTSLVEYQKQKIIKTIAENDYVAIRACHDVGKTFTMAKIVLWIGSAFPGSKIITTAPTFLQVEKLLWSEIRAGFNKSKYPLGGKMLTTSWEQDEEWFALGMSPKDDGSTEQGQGSNSRFQGFHAQEGYTVVIFDEATGVHTKRWDQAEGMLTSHKVKFICIGNPTSKSTPFFRCFTDPTWAKVHISCFDSPNLSANGILNKATLMRELDRLRELPEEDRLTAINNYKVVSPMLLTTKWVVRMCLKNGIDHPLVVSKVFGEFPDEENNIIVPLGVAEAAQHRTYEFDQFDARYVGVDVARFGTNNTVITHLEGWQQVGMQTLVKRDAPAIQGTLINLFNGLERKRFEYLLIDETGLGGPIVDNLRAAQNEGLFPKNVEIVGINFGATFDKELNPEDFKAYENLKAKMYIKLGEDIRKDLCLLPENIYLEELPTIVYNFNRKNGKYKMETKEEYCKRTGRESPDSSDSLALANFGRYVNAMKGVFGEQMGAGGNPFAGSHKSGDQW